MTANPHPVARIQDLIDQLKSETRRCNEYEDQDLPHVWNELEDLLVMLVTPNTLLESESEVEELRKKAKLWDAVVSMVSLDALTQLSEKVNAHIDEARRGIDQDRGDNNGESPGGEGGSSTSGDRSPKGSGGTQGGGVQPETEGQGNGESV